MTGAQHAGRAREIFEVMMKVGHASGAGEKVELTEADWRWVCWALGVAHEQELSQSRTTSVETLRKASGVMMGGPAADAANEEECFWYAGETCTCGKHPKHEWKFSKE